MNPIDAYIVLFEHENYSGATLTIKVREGVIQHINFNNHLYARCSSFELIAPQGVRVTLHKWPPGHDRHSIDKNTWANPDRLVNKPDLESRNLHDAITCIVWDVDGWPAPDPGPNNENVFQTGTATDEPARRPEQAPPGESPADGDPYCISITPISQHGNPRTSRFTVYARDKVALAFRVATLARQYPPTQYAIGVSEGACALA